MRPAINWIARSSPRAFIIIFLLGLSIRLFFLAKMPVNYILPHDRWEDSAIATALVERGHFADPYMIATGPTAHLAPIVPGVVALFWFIFGMGLAGGYAAIIFSLAASSALYGMLPWFGGKLGLGRQAGVLGGITGSLIPVWPGNSEELAGIVLGLLAVIFLQRWTKGPVSFKYSLLLGIGCGAAFHLQPVLLPVVSGWMIHELWLNRERIKWYLSFTVILGMVIACVPWGLRNYNVFEEIFFIRSNLGLELRMGNHEGAYGAMEVMDTFQEHRHPRTHLQEAEQVKELGEVKYMRQARGEALDWIKTHPGEFIQLTASRTIQFWFGPFHEPWVAVPVTLLTILAILGIWFSKSKITPSQKAVLLIPLIFFPIIYYIVAYMPRYRVPIDWLLFLLAGTAIWHWLKEQ